MSQHLTNVEVSVPMLKKWRTDVVSLVLPSGEPSNELEKHLNELDEKYGRTVVQIVPIPNSHKVMVVSRWEN